MPTGDWASAVEDNEAEYADLKRKADIVMCTMGCESTSFLWWPHGGVKYSESTLSKVFESIPRRTRNEKELDPRQVHSRRVERFAKTQEFSWLELSQDREAWHEEKDELIHSGF